MNVANIGNIVGELFQENVVRGRGLLARSIIQAQAASPVFTHVYAALVAVINTKFPQTGELIAKRLVSQFRKGYRRNDKVCSTSRAMDNLYRLLKKSFIALFLAFYNLVFKAYCIDWVEETLGTGLYFEVKTVKDLITATLLFFCLLRTRVLLPSSSLATWSTSRSFTR